MNYHPDALTVAQVKAAGGYGIISADPAWQYNDRGSNGSAENHYPTMTIEELKRLPVGEIAAKDSVLLLWECAPLRPEAQAVIEAWGFRYVTRAFSWFKTRGDKWHFGLGRWTRGNAEDCLLAVRGKPHKFVRDFGVSNLITGTTESPYVYSGFIRLDFVDIPLAEAIGIYFGQAEWMESGEGEFQCWMSPRTLARLRKFDPNSERFGIEVQPEYSNEGEDPIWFELFSDEFEENLIAPVTRHSAKPVEARQRIDRLFLPEIPRIELFAREQAPGWDVWGNEVLSSVRL